MTSPDSEAGVVQIWDTGTYRNLKEIHQQTTMTMEQELERGKMLFPPRRTETARRVRLSQTAQS